MENDFEKYELYLNMIQNKIDGFFENQKPYIFCKKGCALCCEKGEYPFSKMEFDYLMEAFKKLPEETRNKILKKAEKIKKERMEYKGKDIFLYECPFLIDKVCSVYEKRGIICRTFGIPAHRENKPAAIPFCSNMGLNYSNVYDEKTGHISEEKFKKTGIKVEPLVFMTDYHFLTQEKFAKIWQFDFGEKRRLIDWF